MIVSQLSFIDVCDWGSTNMQVAYIYPYQTKLKWEKSGIFVCLATHVFSETGWWPLQALDKNRNKTKKDFPLKISLLLTAIFFAILLSESQTWPFHLLLDTLSSSVDRFSLPGEWVSEWILCLPSDWRVALYELISPSISQPRPDHNTGNFMPYEMPWRKSKVEKKKTWKGLSYQIRWFLGLFFSRTIIDVLPLVRWRIRKQKKKKKCAENIKWKSAVRSPCSASRIYVAHTFQRLRKFSTSSADNRPFQLVHFVFPFQTTWCYSRE